MRIAIVINTSWNIYNFRMSLLKALLAEGHEVVAVAPADAYTPHLRAVGCQFVQVDMDNSANPFKDMLLAWRLYRAYTRVKPDVVLHYTVKPNIYGTLAAHWAGIPAISNVSGLGTVFIARDYVSDIVIQLYRYAFRFPSKVFFQNEDDRGLFLEQGLVQKEITELVPGSGIDLQKFMPVPGFSRNSPFIFLMVARVLYDKGVREYVEASRLVRETYPQARCQLLGMIDERSRSGVKRQQLEKWINTGVIEYLGSTDEVSRVIAKADAVVLPSYREGTSRALLEAAAMGKPLIATDVPGCREVVEHGVNGFLCQVRNAADLAAKMLQMLQTDEKAVEQMGRSSRAIAETRFDDRFVIAKYLKAIDAVSRKSQT